MRVAGVAVGPLVGDESRELRGSVVVRDVAWTLRHLSNVNFN